MLLLFLDFLTQCLLMVFLSFQSFFYALFALGLVAFTIFIIKYLLGVYND